MYWISLAKFMFWSSGMYVAYGSNPFQYSLTIIIVRNPVKNSKKTLTLNPNPTLDFIRLNLKIMV